MSSWAPRASRRAAARSRRGGAGRRRRPGPCSRSRAPGRTSKPACTAPPMPRLNGSRSTRAPAALGDGAGVVGGAVVDHEHVELRRVHAQGADHVAHGDALVVRRDDGEVCASRVQGLVRKALSGCESCGCAPVQLDVPGGGRAPTEPAPRASSRRARRLARRLGIRRHRSIAPAIASGRVRIEQQRGIAADLAQRGAIGGGHRAAAGHRLERRRAEALVEAREDHRLARAR